jgi:hypothetical protein
VLLDKSSISPGVDLSKLVKVEQSKITQFFWLKSLTKNWAKSLNFPVKSKKSDHLNQFFSNIIGLD